MHQRQDPLVQTCQKAVETLQLQFSCKTADQAVVLRQSCSDGLHGAANCGVAGSCSPSTRTAFVRAHPPALHGERDENDGPERKSCQTQADFEKDSEEAHLQHARFSRFHVGKWMEKGEGYAKLFLH